MTDACFRPAGFLGWFQLAAVRRRVCQSARAIDHARALFSGSWSDGGHLARDSSIPARDDNESPPKGDIGSRPRFASVYWSFRMKG
jgi:hypothetical protein